MSEQETRVGAEELQFDHVATTGSTSSSAPSTLAVICSACQTPIDTEYYDVNGATLCSRCRTAVLSAAETPLGLVPLIVAGVFGLGAGVIGAALYFAVIAITHLEIGIVAILIGYMVGYAVRKGARGRGGLRFQVLAIVLTYGSIALAYTPIVIKAGIDANRKAQQAPPATASRNSNAATGIDSRRATAAKQNGGGLAALLMLLAFILALPVMVVVGSLPSGLISAFIIFIGMRQAWRMTASPQPLILGPYRVGATPAAIPA